MGRRSQFCCVCLLAAAVTLGGSVGASAASEDRHSYIVVLNKDVSEPPAAVAHAQALQHGGRLGFVYSHAIAGYSVELPETALAGLEHDPRVAYVTEDGPIGITEGEVGPESEDNEGVELLEPALPTGVSRTFAASNKALDIDGEDDVRANVDVAVIDSGIDQSLADLNVVSRTDCTSKSETCVDGAGTDENSHGTHVAGTIGAIDNGVGVVGIAPGARLWSVRVLNAAGTGSFSQVIAGVDWVAAHAGEIEVANMSIGSNATNFPLNEAIAATVQKGVVFVVAAGNANTSINSSPANAEGVIAVSAIADFDGQPGGKASPTCSKEYGADDYRASFSDFGPLVDIAAPGVCILSTLPKGGYGFKSGTSMASPHVAGAAALLAAKNNPNSAADVAAITGTLRSTGNYNWVDNSGDGTQEPLLDLSNESVYSLTAPPAVVTGPVTYSGVGAATQTFLTATVAPNGLSTTYQFEYVEAAKYKPGAENPYLEGTRIPLAPKSPSGPNHLEYELEEAVAGLAPSTTYHYRIVAENSKGVSKGGDRSFTSLPSCKGSGGQCQWSLQSAANPEPKTLSEFADVSCASSTMCMGVGNDNYDGKGFSELWDGTSWKMVSSFEGDMRSISCPTTTWCMAVARYADKGWRLQWTEALGRWGVASKAPPLPEGATQVSLNDVSCTSESACTVVGRYYVAEYKPYVARWNGTSWTLQSAPNPAEGDASEAMLSVSCASSTSCLAVGRAAKKPFAERWSGSEWSRVSAPNPEGAAEAVLQGISCPTASACAAVGYYKGATGPRKTLAESWNGSAWSATASPNPSGEPWAQLLSVSCLSASSCVAVGASSSPGLLPTEEKTLAESWNGAAWTLQASPNSETSPFSALAAVSCTAAAACSAVGSSASANRSEAAEIGVLAERWKGTAWSLQSAVNSEPKTLSELVDVSCAGSTMCMAVGDDYYQGKGFTELWNGSTWKVLSSFEGDLKAISCPTTTWCMMVARTAGKGWRLQWIEGLEKWGGTSKTPPLPEGATNLTLDDVFCTSETACTVVGSYYAAGYKPYVARWNGTSWTLQSAPNPTEGDASEAMLSVSCSSSTSCLAVGWAAKKPFAERWNGNEWTRVSAPNPEGATEAVLQGISCPAASSCTAVGYYKGSSGRKTLAERWNGSSWSATASPNPSGEPWAQLQEVSCLSASSCIAVGLSRNASLFPSEEKTLAESWNGTSWTLQASPNPEVRAFNAFGAVSCTSTVACAAVGSSASPTRIEATETSTLAERWS